LKLGIIFLSGEERNHRISEPSGVVCLLSPCNRMPSPY